MIETFDLQNLKRDVEKKEGAQEEESRERRRPEKREKRLFSYGQGEEKELFLS